MPTIDGHVDLPWHLTRFSNNPHEQRSQADHLYRRAEAGGLDYPVCALFLSDPIIKDLGIPRAWELLKKQADLVYPWPISLEGARVLEGSVERLQELKHWGVSFITLCHNYDNDLCGSATDSTGKGLTPLGRKIVREINRLGMYVDVSHASDRTVLDVCSITDRPVIASHSGCRAITFHPRNLSDRLIGVIRETYGIMGIPLAERFVESHDGFRRHVAHALRRGIRVGIGSDLYGAKMIPSVIELGNWKRFLQEELATIPGPMLSGVLGGSWLSLLWSKRRLR